MSLAGTLAERLPKMRAAQQKWASTPIADRLIPVKELRHLLAIECDAVCAAVAADLGKSADETIGGEILPVAGACQFLESEAARLLKPRRVPKRLRPTWLLGQSDIVHRRPRGVVGIIGTWNYPLLLNGVQIIQALTAGNAVVWKPSEVAPHSAAKLLDLLHRAGFPDDLIFALDATREAGQVLADAAIDHVVFTGSAPVGRKIAAHLGERLISSTMELSGCDALFVLDDADVKLAANAAWFGAMLNRGQTCLAVRRCFVPRSLYSEFQDELRTIAATATPQRLALSSQVDQANRMVVDALAKGARRLTEPPPATADTFPPTVIIDANAEMALCQEASFAPLFAVIPYDEFDDAIGMNAHCPYRLAASIFTKTPARAQVLADRLKVGMVTINDVVAPTAHPATPFGGNGDSGWGVTQGAEGLLEMTVTQVVSNRSGTFRPHYDMVIKPGQVKQSQILRGALQSAHARTFWGRIGGWWRLLRGIMS